MSNSNSPLPADIKLEISTLNLTILQLKNKLTTISIFSQNMVTEAEKYKHIGKFHYEYHKALAEFNNLVSDTISS